MDLINGFGWASSGFGSDPPIGSGQARGSLHLVVFVFGVSKSKDRASSSFRIIAAYQNIGVEMGPNYHGFCGWVIIDREEA